MSSTSELDSLSKREKKTVSWYDQNDQKVVGEESIVIEVDDESQTKMEKDVEIQVRRVRQSFDLYFLKMYSFIFSNKIFNISLEKTFLVCFFQYCFFFPVIVIQKDLILSVFQDVKELRT